MRTWRRTSRRVPGTSIVLWEFALPVAERTVALPNLTQWPWMPK